MNSENKNNSISSKIRQKGNAKFIKSGYFESLALYNEALRYAEANSVELGLLYGNRSAAFLKVRQYKACLQNIEWARQNNYPADKLPKLRQREIECLKLQEADQASIEEPWNDFFRLSYKPNKAFPYLAECITLKKHKRGMLMATNRKLKAGDIIAVTKPFFKTPIDTSSYRCNYCLADKFMNFVPCLGCTKVMFCDETCMNKALNEFHQFECGIHDNPPIDNNRVATLRMIMKCVSLFDGSREKLEKFLSIHRKDLITPFDFVMENPSNLVSERNLMLTHFSIHQQIDSHHNLDETFVQMEPFLKRHPTLRDKVTHELYSSMVNIVLSGDMKFFKTIDGEILSSLNDQSGLITINYYGSAIDVCSQFFLFSCAPNVMLHPYNGQIVWIVMYPIDADDWLTVAYQNTMFYEKDLEVRKQVIHHIVCCCECPACVGRWDSLLEVAITPVMVMRRSSEMAIEEFKAYCKDINKKFKPLRGKCDKSLWLTISHFRWNLFSIGKATFWNQIQPFDIRKCFNFKDIEEALKGMGIQYENDC